MRPSWNCEGSEQCCDIVTNMTQHQTAGVAFDLSFSVCWCSSQGKAEYPPTAPQQACWSTPCWVWWIYQDAILTYPKTIYRPSYSKDATICLARKSMSVRAEQIIANPGSSLQRPMTIAFQIAIYMFQIFSNEFLVQTCSDSHSSKQWYPCLHRQVSQKTQLQDHPLPVCLSNEVVAPASCQ